MGAVSQQLRDALSPVIDEVFLNITGLLGTMRTFVQSMVDNQPSLTTTVTDAVRQLRPAAELCMLFSGTT